MEEMRRAKRAKRRSKIWHGRFIVHMRNVKLDLFVDERQRLSMSCALSYEVRDW